MTEILVRSADVMEALRDLFASLRGQKLSVADVGIRVYQALSAVPVIASKDFPCEHIRAKCADLYCALCANGDT